MTRDPKGPKGPKGPNVGPKGGKENGNESLKPKPQVFPHLSQRSYWSTELLDLGSKLVPVVVKERGWPGNQHASNDSVGTPKDLYERISF